MIGVKDAFNAGLLCELNAMGITRDSIKQLSEDEWDRIIAKASAFAVEVSASDDSFVSSH